jgi:hypothetical protein
MKNSPPEEALKAFAQAPPPEGLEARVLRHVQKQRLAPQTQQKYSSAWMRTWAWLPAAVALSLAAYLVIPAHLSTPAPYRVASNHAPAPELPSRSPQLRSAKQLPPHHHARATTRIASTPPPVTRMPQEQLLQAFAAAQRRAIHPDLRSITVSETVATGHGLGRNAILELPQQTLTPIPPMSPMPTGEIE